MDWLEGRRFRAWELLEAVWRQVEVEEVLGVTKGAVSQWVKRAREGAREALRRHPAPGAASKLNPEQVEKLPELLSRGAEAYGFRGDVWTHPRIAAVIQAEFGVKYHDHHIPRLLAKIRWTRQKPRRRTSQRNEAAIQQWQTSTWPETIRKAEEAKQTIVFMDESGFRLLPALVHTYAPRGQTPILDIPLTHDHLSVMGALTLDGRLFTWIQDHSVKGSDIVRFVKHLLAHIAGNVLLVWDNLPAYHGQALKAFLMQPAAKRLTLQGLPAYAPELNPQEGIWRFLKYAELKNVCCHHLAELRLEVRRAIERLRFKVDVILGCVRQTGYLVERSKST
jgi:transposase